MTLAEEFKAAFDSSNISNIEMSWNMRVTQDRFNELINGASPNDAEELEMYRFIFKQKKREGRIPYHPVDSKADIKSE